MKAIICIQLDNAAFAVEDEDGEGDRPGIVSGTELAKVLRRLAAEVDDLTLEHDDTCTARDTNGNTVAEMEITEDMLTV